MNRSQHARPDWKIDFWQFVMDRHIASTDEIDIQHHCDNDSLQACSCAAQGYVFRTDTARKIINIAKGNGIDVEAWVYDGFEATINYGEIKPPFRDVI